jgi:hypothetical protein
LVNFPTGTVLSAPRAPWQRAYVERVIGTIRRELWFSQNIDVIDKLRFALLPLVRMRARPFGSIRESLGIIPQAGGAAS